MSLDMITRFVPLIAGTAFIALIKYDDEYRLSLIHI